MAKKTLSYLWLVISVALFVAGLLYNVINGYKCLMTGDHAGWWSMLFWDLVATAFLYKVPALHCAIWNTLGLVWSIPARCGGLYIGTPFDEIVPISTELRDIAIPFPFSTPTGSHGAHGHGARQACMGILEMQYMPDIDDIFTYYRVGVGKADDDLGKRGVREAREALSPHQFNEIRDEEEPVNLLLSWRFRASRRPDEGVPAEDKIPFFKARQSELHRELDEVDEEEKSSDEEDYGVRVKFVGVVDLHEAHETENAEEGVRQMELLIEQAKIILEADPQKKDPARAMTLKDALEAAHVERQRVSRTIRDFRSPGGTTAIVDDRH